MIHIFTLIGFHLSSLAGILRAQIYADVVKLVYTVDLGSAAVRRESSSLSIRTIFF